MLTNSIQIPFNFHFNLLKSSPLNFPKNKVFRRPILSGGCYSRRRHYHLKWAISEGGSSIMAQRRSNAENKYSTITGARKTEHEEQASTSQNDTAHEVSRFQSPNSIHDSESSCDDISTTDAEEATLQSQGYASALKTVGLCVFSAVVFGVVIGFKDGAGKASEFFAGYEQ